MNTTWNKLTETFGPVNDFLIAAGWHSHDDFSGWTDPITKVKYPNSLIPYLIESIRQDRIRTDEQKQTSKYYKKSIIDMCYLSYDDTKTEQSLYDFLGEKL
jgi:hypothetical protein